METLWKEDARTEKMVIFARHRSKSYEGKGCCCAAGLGYGCSLTWRLHAALKDHAPVLIAGELYTKGRLWLYGSWSLMRWAQTHDGCFLQLRIFGKT